MIELLFFALTLLFASLVGIILIVSLGGLIGWALLFSAGVVGWILAQEIRH